MFDRIDLTTTPGQDRIIASTVLSYDKVFTGDDPLEAASAPEAPVVFTSFGGEPNDEPIKEPEPEINPINEGEPDDEFDNDDEFDDDDETENLDDDEDDE